MRRNKYNSRQITAIDGSRFDSQREYWRWCQLLVYLRAGKIQDLKRQVKFELIPAQYETFERYSKTGRRLKDGSRCKEKAVSYVADFTYRIGEELVVEDVKGVRTETYILKRKLMLYIHGIEVKEV